jgi:hypothetical protein
MRYYFHIHIGGDLVFDDEGIELENEELAREEAIRSAAELARDYPRGDRPLNPQLISVLDETKREIFVVPIN